MKWKSELNLWTKTILTRGSEFPRGRIILFFKIEDLWSYFKNGGLVLARTNISLSVCCSWHPHARRSEKQCWRHTANALRSVRLFRVTAWRCGSVRTPQRGGPADRHRTPTHTTHKPWRWYHRPQATKPSVHIPICFVVSFMCRRRFEGGPEELACALAPHMEVAGALRYLDQEPGMSQPTVDKLKLQRQPLKGALQALHGLASNLSFTKSCMSEALAMVAQNKKI